MSDTNVVQFIPRDEWERQLDEQLEAQEFPDISKRNLPKTVSREKVVEAFHHAFELIGGIPRFALWANENPKEFYRLYARLLPSQASQEISGHLTKTIKHVLPRGPLDGDPQG